jgi:hypothetical protein
MAGALEEASFSFREMLCEPTNSAGWAGNLRAWLSPLVEVGSDAEIENFELMKSSEGGEALEFIQ